MAVTVYAVVATLVLASFARDRRRTIAALGQAAQSARGLVRPVLAALTVMAVLMAFFDTSEIGALARRWSGPWGVVACLLLGMLVQMPSVIAYPMAAIWLSHGASHPQVGAFLGTLMSVSAVSLPMEVRQFGARVTALRHGVCVLAASAVAVVLWLMCG